MSQAFNNQHTVFVNPKQKQKGILIGRPIPRDFFETTGKGESDHQIHAGSYHFALQEAGIEKANIMSYSSILPAIANKVPKAEGTKQIVHGEEMKVIQAASSVDKLKGEARATAAIMYAWLYSKVSKEKVGGLVAEYSGNGTLEEAKENLKHCLNELYTNKDHEGNSFAKDNELKDVNFICETIEPQKRYGTALAALAFVNHFVPIIAH